MNCERRTKNNCWMLEERLPRQIIMTNSNSPFRRVLVATDFSAPASTALKHGIWLGEKAQARVTVANVLTSLSETFIRLPYAAKTELLRGDISKFERALRADSQQKLKKLVRSSGRCHVSLKTEVLLGNPDVAITRAVLKERHDVTVCGTRGMSGLKRFLLGSTAQRLVRLCPSSVWIVKPDSVCPPKRILAGIDFSEVSRIALQHASWLAGLANAVLDVVHVVDLADLFAGIKSRQAGALEQSDLGHQVETDARKHMEQWCEETLTATTPRNIHVLWGTPWKVLADRSRRWRCDLVVMGTVGRSGVSGLMLGNTAEKALSHCDCSLFTVKSPEFASTILPPFWELHPSEEPPLKSATLKEEP